MRTPYSSILILALAAAGARASDAPPRFIERCAGQECERSVAVGQQQHAPSTFVVNRTENGTFDVAAGFRAWGPFSRNGATGSVIWTSADEAGNPSSGSASVTNTGGNPDPSPTAYSQIGQSQCVRPGDVVYATPLVCYTGGGRVRVAAGQVPGNDPWEGVLWFGATFYDSTDCSGTAFYAGASGLSVTPQGTNGWANVGQGGPCNTRASARSIRYHFALEKQNSVPNPITAEFDAIDFRGKFGFVKGDLDRDGETDIVLRNTSTGRNASWSMRDEVRQGSPSDVTPDPPSLDWQIAGVDDFGTDDLNDLLMWNSVTGATEFWLMNGVARIGAPAGLAGPGVPWKPSATADFNADGKADIVWRNKQTQKLTVWLMNGTTQASAVVPSPDQAVDANWEIVGAVDINRDGHTDFLWYNSTSGKIVYWLMDGSITRISGNFTNPANAGANNWKVLATGDYGIGPASGPGIPAPDTTDLIWRNADSGRMVVWFMDQTGARSGGTFVSPDPPAPATTWTVAGPR